jgi:hypothetical protein
MALERLAGLRIISFIFESIYLITEMQLTSDILFNWLILYFFKSQGIRMNIFSYSSWFIAVPTSFVIKLDLFSFIALINIYILDTSALITFQYVDGYQRHF